MKQWAFILLIGAVMTTYNTGNAVGSTDPRDLYDNAENLDLLNVGVEMEYPDRLGVPRKSWAGLERQVADFLVSQGWESVYVQYAVNAVVQRPTQLVEREGELYRVRLQSDLPLTLSGTWTTDAPKLVAVGNQALRDLLASPDGAAMVGYGAQTVKTRFDELAGPGGAETLGFEGGSIADALRSATAKPPFLDAVTPLLSKEQTTICIIGDSLSTGQGATSPDFGWTNRLAESIYETFDGDVNSSVRSLGYPVLSNMREALSMPGITGNGTLITGYGTPSNELYRLLHNNYIEVTGRQAEYYDLFYDREANSSDMTEGNIEISVNGVLKATKAVTTGTGVGTTYPTGLTNPLGPLGAKIRPTDVVRFTFKSTTAAAGDRVYVVGLSTVRQNSNNGPHVVKFNYPGWTFGNFLPLMTKIKSMVYAVRHSGTTPELYILALGSNSIYNASVAQTPAQYVSSLAAMATAIGLSATRKMAVWIPPKANSATQLAPYQDYVNAIRAYCSSNDITCIDLSKSAVSSAYGSLLTDTIHWNNAGHGVVASDVLSALGLPYTPRNQAKTVPPPNLYSPITLSAPWGNLGGNAVNAPIAKIKNNIVYLSGIIQPNAAANGAIGSLPGGYQPGTRTLYAPVLSSSGMVYATITAGGAVTLSTFNATWYSLDGISFPLPSDVQ